jgi:hypothetical protein
MNIIKIFKDDRDQSIASLQLCFFLKETYYSLLQDYDSKNYQIQEFIDTVGKLYFWQTLKVKDYIILLKDSVFWESKNIYLTNMEKFVSDELTAVEFANQVYWQIRSDRRQSENLLKDFEKQADSKLSTKIFQFSKIISDLELLLEDYAFERNTKRSDLEDVIKNVLPIVKKYCNNEI